MSTLKYWPFLLGFFSLLLGSATSKSPSKEFADTLYFGGPILTMEDKMPVVEAVAIKNGKIIFSGKKRPAFKLAGSLTQIIDLQGKTLMPGFIDTHGHISQVAQTSNFANLAPPPVGTVGNFADLRRTLMDYIRQNRIPAGWPVLGFNYDDANLEEHRHPDREVLDDISTEHPIILIHVSGHLASLNSRALSLMQINESTPDPSGGFIRRYPGTRKPSGILEEEAINPLFSKFPSPPAEVKLQNLLKAEQLYARNGITTANDGYSQRADLELFRLAAERRQHLIDIVAFPVFNELNEAAIHTPPSKQYSNHFKTGGVKITLDGSPQGKTAYFTKPYRVPKEGEPESYRGYPRYSDALVDSVFLRYIQAGWPIHGHANGDAAIDQMLNAVGKAYKAFPEKLQAGLRHTIIHCQTVREDQLDLMKTYKIIPSLFVAHTFFWGDWHIREILGEERAYRISPAKSCLDRGLVFNFHNDAPVVSPNMLMLVWTGVNRLTRSGIVLGKEQQISVWDALKAVTIHAAYEYYEEDQKGSIRQGKMADFVILDQNPLAIDPLNLKTIQVLETIKEGKSIFKKEG